MMPALDVNLRDLLTISFTKHELLVFYSDNHRENVKILTYMCAHGYLSIKAQMLVNYPSLLQYSVYEFTQIKYIACIESLTSNTSQRSFILQRERWGEIVINSCTHT